MRQNLMAALLLVSLAGCNGKATEAKISDLESRNADLSQRLAKTESRLDEAEKKLVQHEQAMQVLNDRLKTAETAVDKLAYGSAPH